MSKEILNNSADRIAVIRLTGSTYHHEIEGLMVDCTDTLEALAVNSNYEQNLNLNIRRNREHLEPLIEGGYRSFYDKIAKGEPLSYSEAFGLIAYVSSGVNKLVYSKIIPLIKPNPNGPPNDPDTVYHRAFTILGAMTGREGSVGLTPEEIAGMTAATLELDTIVRVPVSHQVIGVGGMGGDRGYGTSKLFSLSTLGAIVMANFSYVHKHHSYPNTSAVAGQTAIEEFGARSDQSSPRSLAFLQENVRLLMSSAHTIRTIHTLSHRTKGETINHVIGPLAIPVERNTPVHAFVGVNDNVHPETIIKALLLMQKNGTQRYFNSVAFCGLNNRPLSENLFNPEKYYVDKNSKLTVAIDEVAPPPYKTLAAFLVNGRDAGTYLIEPLDFMNEIQLKNMNLNSLLIPNTKESIMSANVGALTGSDVSKAFYLAMTAALGLFTKEYLNLPNALDQRCRKVNRTYLREAFQRSLRIIYSGKAYKKFSEIISAQKGDPKAWLPEAKYNHIKIA